MSAGQLTMTKQEERLLYYQLFCHYYRGDLLQLPEEKWRQLGRILRENESSQLKDEVDEAIQTLEKVNESTLLTFEYDYNRLFVGPGKLLASPFESSYRNFEGAVFQQETLKVRNFYHHVGLQVTDEGKFPDDHIQFELEFILHILNDSNNDEKAQILQMFLEKHLLQWGFKHCERILKHSQNPITYAMGVLLKEFLQCERKWLEGGTGNVN